jgi:hypothetical protein
VQPDDPNGGVQMRCLTTRRASLRCRAVATAGALDGDVRSPVQGVCSVRGVADCGKTSPLVGVPVPATLKRDH